MIIRSQYTQNSNSQTNSLDKEKTELQTKVNNQSVEINSLKSKSNGKIPCASLISSSKYDLNKSYPIPPVFGYDRKIRLDFSLTR